MEYGQNSCRSRQEACGVRAGKTDARKGGGCAAKGVCASHAGKSA